MAYEIPRSKASIRQNQFEFNIEGRKKKHYITRLEYMPIGKIYAYSELQAKLRAGGHDATMDEVFELFEAAGMDKDFFESLSMIEIGGLIQAWGEEAGISLEKS